MVVLTLVLFNPSGIGYAGGSLLVLLALPRGAYAGTDGRQGQLGAPQRTEAAGPRPRPARRRAAST
jgi:hypothetical protein